MTGACNSNSVTVWPLGQQGRDFWCHFHFETFIKAFCELHQPPCNFSFHVWNTDKILVTVSQHLFWIMSSFTKTFLQCFNVKMMEWCSIEKKPWRHIGRFCYFDRQKLDVYCHSELCIGVKVARDGWTECCFYSVAAAHSRAGRHSEAVKNFTIISNRVQLKLSIAFTKVILSLAEC